MWKVSLEKIKLYLKPYAILSGNQQVTNCSLRQPLNLSYFPER